MSKHKSIEEVIGKCRYRSDIIDTPKAVAQALKDEGYIHKSEVRGLDVEKVAQCIGDTVYNGNHIDQSLLDQEPLWVIAQAICDNEEKLRRE